MTLLYNNGKWPTNLGCPYKSDEEEDEILELSEAFQKLDDLLLFAHHRQDRDLSKMLIIVIGKAENATLSELKETNIVKFFK